MPDPISIKIVDAGKEKRFEAPLGANLREFLLSREVKLYRGKFAELNCRGLGICGSCRVWKKDRDQLWERKACQMTCSEDIEVHLGVQ